jgi:response regulator RpfG family c-di-GMP phosphodiesterase
MTEQNQKILVVDDERFNINVLVDLLKPSYKMMAVKNGEQALKATRSADPPDLILLDIMMPEMDGYEVCRRLKADETTRDIPVIFVTAMGDVQDETKGLEMGAVDYITKPISPPIVSARVRTHLTLKQKRDELAEMAEHLEHLNREKNKMLGMAAHDLRNPLSSISGFSEILLSGDLGPVIEEHKEFLSIIHSQARYMLQLVNDLLDVSVIEAGKLELHRETASLTAMAEERIRIHKISADKKEMRF